MLFLLTIIVLFAVVRMPKDPQRPKSQTLKKPKQPGYKTKMGSDQHAGVKINFRHSPWFETGNLYLPYTKKYSTALIFPIFAA